MPITALYAGLLTPIFLVLAVRVILVRRNQQIGVGDGGNPVLLRRMRVHANFAEYVPLAVLLLGLAESLGTPRAVLHGIGIALLLARLSHAYGMSQPNETLLFRVFGVVTTFLVLVVAAGACLCGAIVRP